MEFLKKTFFAILLMPAALGTLNFADSHSSIVHSGLFKLQNVLPANQSQEAQGLATANASAAVDKVTPSVVTIFGVEKLAKPVKVSFENSNITARLDSWKQSSTEQMAIQTSVSTGTGFFVSTNGYILTNKHVVSNEKAVYSAVLSDGSEHPLTVVYRDPDTDLAIAKIRGENYIPAILGDSSTIKKHQKILNIGNSYVRADSQYSYGEVIGTSKAVYAGDPVTGSEEYLDNVIEVDTQLYPGDSGGPMIDMNGQVVGINVAAAKDAQSVSFSIPINEAKLILNSVFGYGTM